MLDSITDERFITGPFGWQIPRFPPHYAYVYLLHFEQKIGNPDNPRGMAGHYLGSTGNLEARLQLHRSGLGAKLTHAVSEAGIGFEVVRLWRTETCEEARALEHKLKQRHEGPRLCPLCRGKQVDALVMLRQGHWPMHLHSAPGRRQPIGEQAAHFVRYTVPTTLWQLL